MLDIVDLLNASDFEVLQDRKRIFFVGIHQDLNFKFEFPKPLTLQHTISDLKENVVPAKEDNQTNIENWSIANHEYIIGGFSSIFMSRNRVISWYPPSFTIQAGGGHAPIHPQGPKN